MLGGHTGSLAGPRVNPKPTSRVYYGERLTVSAPVYAEVRTISPMRTLSPVRVIPAPRKCRARVGIQPGRRIPAQHIWPPVRLLGPGYPMPALRTAAIRLLHSPVRPVPALRSCRATITIQPGRVVQEVCSRPPVPTHGPVYPVPAPRTIPETMFGSIWGYFYTSFLRYWLKWFIRQVTGKCELQRICAGYKPGAPRTTKAEYSLKNSKSKLLRAAVNVEEDGLEKYLDLVMREKNVKTQRDPTFKVNLKLCLLQITGYRNLFTSVEELRKETFDSDKVQHEEMLLKLWDLLMPEVKLESRVTKQWGDIGFQGDDPKTDFRGMGMLGLTNLVFFSENYTEEARQVLSHANHPKLGYSYAIVGINLTEMAYSLLKSGALKPHFYNTVSGRPQMQHLHQLFCYLVYKFDKFWVEEEPESIMEFNHYREKFHDNIKIQLLDPAVALTMTDSPRSN